MVATLGELKGLAMKAGQMMAMDPDHLTPEIRTLLARLQNQAAPMSFHTVASVVERELGSTPRNAFADFSEAPLAAASVGQVHGARTHDGRDVVVKVQYPGIDEVMAADLKNASAIVSVLGAGFKALDPRTYFEEISAELLVELDYREEARRTQVMREVCAPFPELVVPQVVEALSAKRVLTLEHLPGPTLKDVFARSPRPDNAERFRVARLLMRAIWLPFLTRGMIHADPHPGNFLVLPDGRLGLLDFGAVKSFSPTYVQVNRTLFHASVTGEVVDGVALSKACGFSIPTSDAEAAPFIEGVIRIANTPYRTRDFDFSTSSVNRDMTRHFIDHKLKLHTARPPKEAMMFFRAIGGLTQNLHNLGARGDFIKVHEEIWADAEKMR